jgi:hypothetical protein
MALAYNTKIVRDKLVMHVDIANTKSYPGSGSTLFDISGHNYHGTISGCTIINGHLSFDGTNDAVAFPESNISKDPSLYLGDASGAFTYECWINRQGTSSSTVPRLMSTDCSEYTCLILNNYGDGNVIFYTHVSGNGTNTVSSTGVDIGKWYHICATQDATGLKKMYVNGQVAAQSNPTLASPYGQ